MTPEARVRNTVVAYARSRGCLHIRMHMGRGARTGWPDDLFIFDGRVMFIEFKAPGGAATRMQQRALVNLKAQNIDALVCDDVEYGRRLIERLAHG